MKVQLLLLSALARTRELNLQLRQGAVSGGIFDSAESASCKDYWKEEQKLSLPTGGCPLVIIMWVMSAI